MKRKSMRVPPKNRWKATASSGVPLFAVDDRYATTWTSKASKKAWLKIDLGKPATRAGLEVYWGKQAPVTYGFESSADGKTWAHLCATRHGGRRTGRLCIPSGRRPVPIERARLPNALNSG